MTKTKATYANSMNPRPIRWRCDACGQLITRPQDGWVEWLTRIDPVRGYRCHGLRLVHHILSSPRSGGCYYVAEAEYARDQSTTSDTHLATYLGSDGLMELLRFLDEQSFDDPAEILELIKRLHVPLYEQARLHLKAYLGEDYTPNRAKFPFEETMLAAIRWVRGDR